MVFNAQTSSLITCTGTCQRTPYNSSIYNTLCCSLSMPATLWCRAATQTSQPKLFIQWLLLQALALTPCILTTAALLFRLRLKYTTCAIWTIDTYFTWIFLTISVSSTQKRRQYLLIVSGRMEHLLAYTILDNWHLGKIVKHKATSTLQSVCHIAIAWIVHYFCDQVYSEEDNPHKFSMSNEFLLRWTWKI